MRISKIQSTLIATQNQHRNCKYVSNIKNQPEVPEASVAFRGKGNGALAGLGGGLITGLIAVGGAAIAGVAALPVIVGSAVVLGAGAAGAYVGNKIEDKISEIKNKKD